MQTIHDLEHFVLQDGETLILRARRPLSQEQMAWMQDFLDKRKVQAVVIAGPDFDIMAGVLSNLVPDDDAQAHADAVCDAYDAGKIVWCRSAEGGDWFQIQRISNPLTIDFTNWCYSLEKPDTL